jgi:hypothetical protein
MLGNLLNFAGSLLSGSANRKEARRNRQMAMDQFNAQMDESIQRRVKDAQAAGIHPLFALGGSVGASPTVSTGNSAPTGSGLGDALQALGQGLGITAKNRSEARLDAAQAAYYDALAAKARSDLQSTGRDAVNSGGEVTAFDAPVVSSAPTPLRNSPSHGVAANAPIPQYIDVERPDGRTQRLLNPELNLDEIGQIQYVIRSLQIKAADQMEDLTNLFSGVLQGGDVRRWERELERMRRIRQETPGEREWRERFERFAARWYSILGSGR